MSEDCPGYDVKTRLKWVRAAAGRPDRKQIVVTLCRCIEQSGGRDSGEKWPDGTYSENLLMDHRWVWEEEKRQR